MLKDQRSGLFETPLNYRSLKTAASEFVLVVNSQDTCIKQKPDLDQLFVKFY